MSWQSPPTPAQPRAFDPRHTPRQRLMLVAAVATVVLCFVGAIAIFAVKLIYEQRPVTDRIVNRPTPTPSRPGPTAAPAAGQTSPPNATAAAPVVVDTTSRNFLLAASDTDACIDPGSPWANAAAKDRPDSTRSDTIMVIRLDAKENRIAVLSFPRDLWVKVAGRGEGRINTAYTKNQPNRLIQTLKQNFGIVVDHYIQVDFCAFKQIVDAVGGVDIPFKTPIQDLEHTQLNIKQPGCHHFVGDEALAYARSRHLKQYVDGKWREDLTSDFGRIARQQDLIGRVLARALDKGLLSPSTMTGLLNTLLGGHLVVSADLSIDKMIEFGTALRSIKPDEMGRYRIITINRKIGNASVEIFNPDAPNITKILQIFRGELNLGAVASEVQTNLSARILPDPDTKC